MLLLDAMVRRGESLAQLLTMLIVFAFVLFLAYVTSKFAGNIQRGRLQVGNMQVMETMQLAAGKYLQIVKAGEQYLLIAVTKDQVTFLCELDKEHLDFTKQDNSGVEFRKILSGIQKSGKVDNHEEEE